MWWGGELPLCVSLIVGDFLLGATGLLIVKESLELTLCDGVVSDGIINGVLLKVGGLDGVGRGLDLLAEDLDHQIGLGLLGVVDGDGVPLPGVNSDDLIL